MHPFPSKRLPKSKVCAILLYINLLCLTHLLGMAKASPTFDTTQGFFKIENRTVGLLQPFQNWTRTTLLECARKCSLEVQCLSFMWNTAHGLCTLGCCAMANQGILANEPSRLYAKPHKPCRLDLGYQLRFDGTTLRCIFLSDAADVYHQAKQTCRDHGGRVCKTNTVEFAKLVLTAAAEKYGGYRMIFIGLDDTVTERTYVWSDGKTITTQEKADLHVYPAPSQATDCFYVTSSFRLADVLCYNPNHFCCEIDVSWSKEI